MPSSRRRVLALTGTALLSGCTGFGVFADGDDPPPSPFLTEAADWEHPDYDAAATNAPPKWAAPKTVAADSDWTASVTFTQIDEFAGPIVADGIVYLVVSGAGANERIDRLVALDAQTGDERWHVEVSDGGYAYAPVVAGETVYWLASADVLHALNPADGSTTWRLQTANHNLPLVAHGLVLTVDGSIEKPVLTALDPRTGERYWRRREGNRDWLAVAADADSFYVTLAAETDEQSTELHALDPTTGETRWATDRVTPRHAALTDSHLYTSEGRPDSQELIALDTETQDVEWSVTRDLQRQKDEGIVNGTQSVGAVAGGRVLAYHDFHGYLDNRVVAHDADSGDEVWTVGTADDDDLFPCCPPVVVGDRAYLVLGRGFGSATDDQQTPVVLSIRDLADGSERERVELRSAVPVDSLGSSRLVVADGRLLLTRRPESTTVSVSVR